MQTSVDLALLPSYSTNSMPQLEQLQTQLNQENHMMSIMLANKGMRSPKDHIIGIVYSMTVLVLRAIIIPR